MLSSTTYHASGDEAQQTVFKGDTMFTRILAQATANKWKALPIGDLMGMIATQLSGVPYVANTLELSPEVCSVNLTGLDCVTFFETTLAFARMLKKGGKTPADLIKEVSYTRYRGGVVGDYSSRLHYTSDWLIDNQNKHVVKLLSDLPGAEPFTQKVALMSSHPQSYRQLTDNPKLVAKIKQQEETINSRTLKFIPLNKISTIEPLLQTGDIVGICTNITGLDISHTGLVVRTTDGIAHFMDASSAKDKMKVTLEPGPIGAHLSKSKSTEGAMFARPLEPHV